jgi:hypothetical protein
MTGHSQGMGMAMRMGMAMELGEPRCRPPAVCLQRAYGRICARFAPKPEQDLRSVCAETGTESALDLRWDLLLVCGGICSFVSQKRIGSGFVGFGDDCFGAMFLGRGRRENESFPTEASVLRLSAHVRHGVCKIWQCL